MAACPEPRIANSLDSTGSVVITVPWALQPGQAGYGVGGVTQSGTATYTIALQVPTVPGLPQFLDSCDALARVGSAVIS